MQMKIWLDISCKFKSLIKLNGLNFLFFPVKERHCDKIQDIDKSFPHYLPII